MSNTDSALDLSAFDVETGANEGFQLDLLDKHGAKSGHWIKVLGKDSKEFQRVMQMQNRRRLNRLQKGGKANNLTPEEIEDDSLDLLAACTKAWSFTANGAPYPCTASNAVNLYRSSALIREQVDSAINERENFIKS